MVPCSAVTDSPRNLRKWNGDFGLYIIRTLSGNAVSAPFHNSVVIDNSSETNNAGLVQPPKIDHLPQRIFHGAVVLAMKTCVAMVPRAVIWVPVEPDFNYDVEAVARADQERVERVPLRWASFRVHDTERLSGSVAIRTVQLRSVAS